MELELITDMDEKTWDEAIEAFDTKYLFHQSIWLRFLEETQGAKTLRFRINEGGKTLGYFAGLTVQKGPLRILGSPLPGWTTEYMGPVVNADFDFGKFLDALDGACRHLRIHHVELCSRSLDPDLMRSHGYCVQDSSTYIVPLSADEGWMYRNLDRKCRQNIRKGQSNKLVVEDCDDPAAVDDYYEQLMDVFAKQKLVPSYSVGRVRSMFEILRPGNISVLRVRNECEVIASSLWTYDNRTVYLFGASSWRRTQNLYPNELLYWTGIVMFGRKGLPQLDMCGDGKYKEKYGAKLVPVYKCSKSYNIVARIGREAYRKAFMTKQKLNGRLSALAGTAS